MQDICVINCVSEYLKYLYLNDAIHLHEQVNSWLDELREMTLLKRKEDKDIFNSEMDFYLKKLSDFIKSLKKIERSLKLLIKSQRNIEKEVPKFEKDVHDLFSGIYDTIKPILSFVNFNHSEIITSYKRNNEIFFRGVTAVGYDEIPSILRNNNCEDDKYNEYINEFPQTFANLGLIDVLCDMQHYEFPTRLLDITSNPLVALYMATTNQYSSFNDCDDVFSEVIEYFPQYLNNESQVKFADSHKTEILAALPCLDNYQKDALIQCMEQIQNTSFKDDVIAYLVGKQEFPYGKVIKTNVFEQAKAAIGKLNSIIRKRDFGFNISDEDITCIFRAYYVKPRMANERILAQDGSFILFGLNPHYVSSYFTSTRNTSKYKRLIIQNKQTIREELRLLGYSQKTLTPDLVNVAKFMKNN